MVVNPLFQHALHPRLEDFQVHWPKYELVARTILHALVRIGIGDDDGLEVSQHVIQESQEVVHVGAVGGNVDHGKVKGSICHRLLQLPLLAQPLHLMAAQFKKPLHHGK